MMAKKGAKGDKGKGNLLRVSPSPHIHADRSVRDVMRDVIIALIPVFIASLAVFGIGALIITLTAVASCVFFEHIIQKYLLKQESSVHELSAGVTGLLLAFCLPANLPFWMVILGSLAAIGIGKMSFGGLGNNPFNPALVGRVFLFVSFPVQMSSWPEPLGNWFRYLDAATGPTALGSLSEGMNKTGQAARVVEKIPELQELFMGSITGSAGEVSALAILTGGIYLLWRKVITWHIPVSILVTVFIFTGLRWVAGPGAGAGPLFHLLSGGLLLGAVFMATDYATSPMVPGGMLVYGVGIGLITVIIRIFGSYPEGVQFAILTMNAFVPLINKYIKPRRFG